jgi:beta-N-acetylhexosaminidase
MILCLSVIVGCSQKELGSKQEDLPSDNEIEKENTTKDDPKESEQEKSEPVVKVDKIQQQIDALTLEEKIGQMLMIGFEGQSINEEIEEYLHKYHVGGFIFFERNIDTTEQIQTLIQQIKHSNQGNIPLFLSLDEEGGRVTRLPDDLKSFPNAETIGNLMDPTITHELSTLMARQMKALGFNMNNAPVLDVNSNSENPIIGPRSFGSDADTVIAHAIPFMHGHQEEGIIPVVKHFPGHGDTFVDSHKELPEVNKSLEQLQQLELSPFKEAFKQKADAVMIAHILLPKLDKQYPSSLSQKIITDLLRKQMNFDGVVITDDLTMKAITNKYEVSDAAVQSLEAGSDMLLIAHEKENIVNTFQEIKEAVLDGRIAEKRIDQSVYRILQVKEKYGLSNDNNKGENVAEIHTLIKQFLAKNLQ